MKYAVKAPGGELVSVFEAASLGNAVRIKHQLESMLPIPEIFSVALATSEDDREFQCEGVVVLR
jgi:hypothetical protein